MMKQMRHVNDPVSGKRKRVVEHFQDPRVVQALFGHVRWAWIWLALRLYAGWIWMQAGWCGLDRWVLPALISEWRAHTASSQPMQRGHRPAEYAGRA